MKGGKKFIHFILFHHPPNIIKNPPSNVSKRIKNLPADETIMHWPKKCIETIMHWLKLDLNKQSHSNNRQIYPKQQIILKIGKEKLNIGKKFFSLLEKTSPKST